MWRSSSTLERIVKDGSVMDPALVQELVVQRRHHSATGACVPEADR
jgi:hypothetical protein